jgi:threonine/homoserine/homoserine lactone efflux protein
LLDLHFFLKGLIIGFSIAAPVGPIGILCIRRTLAEGRVPGLISGLGAATADALYGCIAGFGLTFISSFLINQQGSFRLVGGVFLLYLGIRTFLARPPQEPSSAEGTGFMDAYASTFFLTLTNPMTILAFAAIFAGLGAAGEGKSYFSAGVLVMGVFLGSTLWWVILSSGVGLFRKHFDLRALKWINIISGILITGFGLISLLALKS